MKTIVAVDKEWGIGKKNDLLFHLTKDLQYFKEKTLDKVIVMGGNTLLSFPGSKPLPRRTNIVLTDVLRGQRSSPACNRHSAHPVETGATPM